MIKSLLPMQSTVANVVLFYFEVPKQDLPGIAGEIARMFGKMWEQSSDLDFSPDTIKVRYAVVSVAHISTISIYHTLLYVNQPHRCLAINICIRNVLQENGPCLWINIYRDRCSEKGSSAYFFKKLLHFLIDTYVLYNFFPTHWMSIIDLGGVSKLFRKR